MIIDCSVSDLCRLCKKKLSKKQLEDLLSMYGAPPEPGAAVEDPDLIRIEVFPNRPDMLSSEGVARALRGILGKETGLVNYSARSSGITIKVDSSVRMVRPFISAALVETAAAPLDDLSIKSLMQLQEKLHLTHGRKRKKVAIGVHDISRITKKIRYIALPKEDVRFVPLGMSEELSGPEILEKHPKGIDYGSIISGFEKFPVVMDSKGTILSLPPIINGTATEVTPETRTLLIEVTGTDLQAVEQACTIVAASLAERGAVMKTVKIIEGERGKKRTTPILSPRSMKVDSSYIRRILGLDDEKELPDKKIMKLLGMMRFGVITKGNKVLIPSYRTDILHQMDLAEDVAIAYGYNNFKTELPALPNVGMEDAVGSERNNDRTTLIGLGFEEVFTFVLTNPASLFSKMNCGAKERKVAVISNPKSEDFTIVRDQVLPSLLSVLSNNTHNSYPQKIFECGDIVLLDENSDTGCRNVSRLAGLIADKTAGFVSIKQLVRVVLEDKGIWSRIELKSSVHEWFVPGRQADVVLDGRVIGWFGELHPQVLENFGLEMPAAGFELEALPG